MEKNTKPAIGWTRQLSANVFHAVLLIVSIGLFACTMIFSQEYSSFTAALVKGGFGLAVFFLFDKYVLKEVDTIEELKKGNLAYSHFLCGIIAIVIAGIFAS